MIHVDRDAVTIPSPFEGDVSKADKELVRARVAFRPGGPGKFNFAVYRDKDVKEKLEQLFQGKCAYCESSYINTQPMDVEHYRPKGGYVAEGELKKPGYWWLAAEWSNLLPSCIDCNRARWQKFAGDEDDIEDPEEERVSGKANLFPLFEEARRAPPVEGQEINEKPLILDPCRDHPEDLLEFGVDGSVKPRDGLLTDDHKRATESITVYGLDRKTLNGKRRERRLLIMNQYKAVNQLLMGLKEEPNKQQVRQTLATALRAFREFRDRNKEFTLMARQIVDSVLVKIGPFVANRVGDDLPPGPPAEVLDRFIDTFALSEDEGDPDAELDWILGP